MFGWIPLILPSGLFCDGPLWKHQDAAVKDVADCQDIVMTEDNTITGIAARILAQAPAKFALVGFSMGGDCAFEIMRRALDRVARLAVLDALDEADAPSRRSERIAWIAKARSQGLEALVPDHMAVRFQPEHLTDEVLFSVAAQLARRVGLAAYKWKMIVIMDRLVSASTLASISFWALGLCGRKELLAPLHLHELMADAIGKAELVVVGGSGLLSMSEISDVVSAALRQWRGIEV